MHTIHVVVLLLLSGARGFDFDDDEVADSPAGRQAETDAERAKAVPACGPHNLHLLTTHRTPPS